RAAGLSPIVVVTGFAAADVRAALAGRDVGFAHNADHASGLASSLRVGLAALPADCAGAVILLADMPRVAAPLLARLVDAFRARPDAAAVAPVLRGAWGNPLLLARRVFAEAGALQGDAGARRILQGRDDVVAVEVEDEAVALDVDTPEALAALRRGQMS
ncbi:MAG TPA: nucleotidyltransferase family protein, partial [Beijerinckiaceae bacterium]